jgi:hypothetical protein
MEEWHAHGMAMSLVINTCDHGCQCMAWSRGCKRALWWTKGVMVEAKTHQILECVELVKLCT